MRTSPGRPRCRGHSVGSPERIYRGAVRGLSVLIAAIGVAILVRTVAAGGGVLGVVLGLAFVGVGIGRLYIESRVRG